MAVEHTILLPTADLSYQEGLKVIINKVVAVCTPTTLFAVPTKQITANLRGRARQRESSLSLGGVQAIYNKPGQTLPELERELTELCEDLDNSVITFRELKSYKLRGWGPFRQLRLHQNGKLVPISFVPRGKGEMKRFDSYFAQHVPASAPQ